MQANCHQLASSPSLKALRHERFFAHMEVWVLKRDLSQAGERSTKALALLLVICTRPLVDLSPALFAQGLKPTRGQRSGHPVISLRIFAQVCNELLMIFDLTIFIQIKSKFVWSEVLKTQKEKLRSQLQNMQHHVKEAYSKLQGSCVFNADMFIQVWIYVLKYPSRC